MTASLFVGDFMILDWACLIVIVGCLQTMAVRLKGIMAALRAKSAVSINVPQHALHDPIFLAYCAIIFVSLLVGGIALSVLHWGFKKDLGSIWSTYRSWLIMAPVGMAAVFLGRDPDDRRRDASSPSSASRNLRALRVCIATGG